MSERFTRDRALLLAALLTLVGAASPGVEPSNVEFIRGDVDGVDSVTASDPVVLLDVLFIQSDGRHDLPCWSAADANDDGRVGVSDAVYLLGYLFLGTSQPPEPFPDCGLDPTADALTCREFVSCKPPELVNSIGMRFVYCPPGRFVMGSPPDERSRERHHRDLPIRTNEERQHTVELTCGFYIGATEVTVGQYRTVMEAVPPNRTCRTRMEWRPDDVALGCASWIQATEFCSRLAELEGLPPGTYRLPTEAEWEYAARAGTTTRFWFGDLLECDDWQFDCGDLRDEIAMYEHFSRNRGLPARTGQRLPNPGGLMDVHGNVCEFVLDWYAPFSPEPVIDPVGPASGDRRVFRGCGSNWLARGRSAARWGKEIDEPAGGFRVVRALCPLPDPTDSPPDISDP